MPESRERIEVSEVGRLEDVLDSRDPLLQEQPPQFEQDAVADMGKAIHTGQSVNHQMTENTDNLLARTERALQTGKPPLHELRDSLDAEENGGRLSRIVNSLDVIDSKALDIGSHSGNPTGKARIIRERVVDIRKELGVEP